MLLGPIEFKHIRRKAVFILNKLFSTYSWNTLCNVFILCTNSMLQVLCENIEKEKESFEEKYLFFSHKKLITYKLTSACYWFIDDPTFSVQYLFIQVLVLNLQCRLWTFDICNLAALHSLIFCFSSLSHRTTLVINNNCQTLNQSRLYWRLHRQ